MTAPSDAPNEKPCKCGNGQWAFDYSGKAPVIFCEVCGYSYQVNKLISVYLKVKARFIKRKAAQEKQKQAAGSGEGAG